MTKVYNIIRPANLKPLPDKYEERVAELCASYFESDIVFIVRNNHTTPDIRVAKTGQFWEIKNMKGTSNHAVEENLRRANRQADNVIISLLRSPAKDPMRIKARIEYILKNTNVRFQNVMLITKTGKVIDIKSRS